jgi:3-hydroxyisobutyrate dehydrogenase-like beta-hydroxyacid dehydrogenase
LADWEATQLADRAGLDIEQFIEFAKQADRLGSGRMGTVSPMLAGTLQPGQRLARFAHKDLQAALDLAADVELSLPAAALANGFFAGLLSG